MIDRVYIAKERILVPIPSFRVTEKKAPLLFRKMREYGCLMKIWTNGEENLREVKKIEEGDAIIGFNNLLLSLIPKEKIPIRMNKLSIGKEKLMNLIESSFPTYWLFYEDELGDSSNYKKESIPPGMDVYSLIFRDIPKNKFEDLTKFEHKFLWQVWNLTH